MYDNIIGIFNQLKTNLDNYESQTSRENMTPHERVLDILEHDYMRFCNHDEWLAALQEFMTADEAGVWCLYPEYTRTETGITLDQARAKADPHLQGQIAALTRCLVDKGFIYEYKNATGTTYVTTYLLDVLCVAIVYYNDSPLHRAAVKWWNIMADESSESYKFRSTMPEHRVIAHEGTLTGDSKYGKIPMNLDIPDTRQVLDMDRVSQVLKRCQDFAVMECICRKAKDVAGVRECDFPLDVCLLFDESAIGAIDSGMGRRISYDETLGIVRQCRDQGLVQVISNAEHPLAMCNCCECCCICLRTLNRGQSAITTVSRFILDVARPADCIKCGSCMKVCPAHAIDVKENYIQTGVHECIGCGLCVSKCPKNVLRLVKKPGAPDKLDREYLRRIYL